MNELLAGRRLLVVEDEMMVAMLIEDMLGDLGCRSIAVTSTVEQALALLRAGVFDAAMLDMNLRGIASEPVAAALAAGGVPFLLSTGYCDRASTAAFQGRPILRKPFQRGELASVLGRLLEVGCPS